MTNPLLRSFSGLAAGLLLGLAAPARAAESFEPAWAQGAAARLSLKAAFTAADADRTSPLSVYVVALLPDGRWFARTPAGWQPASAAALPPWRTQVSGAERVEVTLLEQEDVRAFAGTALYLGYGREDAGDPLQDLLLGRKYQQVHTLTTNAGAPQPQLPASVPACPTDPSTPLLGTLPLAPSEFLAWRPLGFQSLPIHVLPAKHSAFSMTPPGQTPQPRSLRAPAAATVSEIYEASFSASGKRNYQVFMHPCRELRLYFGHLNSIAPRLQQAFDAAPPRCNSFDSGDGGLTTTCRREGLDLQLQEGEVFGSGPDSAGVDFGALDFRLSPAPFVVPAHYDAYYRYYAAPLDYFKPEPRALLEAKSGSVFGTRLRTRVPLGGVYMQDLPGTAQGNWFVPGRHLANSTDQSPFLGLVHDYADPSRPLLAIGNSVPGLPMGLYSYQPGPEPLRNPALSRIRPGAAYCIDSFTSQSASDVPLARAPAGALLLHLPDALSLQLQWVAGAGCAALSSWLPDASAARFER